jgi:tetratricopeptide (TPR) repeat protein
MPAYGSDEISRMFGLPRSAVRSLVQSGIIRPSRQGARAVYSFQDLIVLRTVSALRAARIPARVINEALRKLRASLPGELPMSRLALTAAGRRVGVRDGASLWETDSGQYALALEIRTDRAGLHTLERTEAQGVAAGAALDAAHADYLRGVDLEDGDERAARRAYEACLAADPGHTEARINLGRMLHLGGLLSEAEAVYRGGADPHAELAFNMAVLLEDLAREAEAIAAYRQAIALDPTLADAHFNLARLLERAGDRQASFRHLLAYRRSLERS